MNFICKLVVIIFIVILSSKVLNSQPNNRFISATKKDYKDTLAFEIMQKLIKDVEGLLEKEIDPDEYIMGPFDRMLASIVTSKPEEVELIVSTEGIVIIPGAGFVNVRGKTLSEARELIINQIRKFYKSENVFVTLLEMRKFKVAISGSIPKPSTVVATAGDRVSEIIDRAGGLQYKASIRNISLIRDGNEIPVDLVKFYLLGDKEANPYVLGGDLIRVPPMDEDYFIEVAGEVSFPEIFEWVKGDSLSTLLKFSQGFKPLAILDSVEFARLTQKGKDLEKRFLDLSDWEQKLFSNQKLSNDFELFPGDRVYIRKKPERDEPHYVVIEGEVLYPGKYPIVEKRDKIYDLIQRAGGFKKEASLEATTFIRQKDLEIKDLELERLMRMNPSDMSESESRYFQVRVRERRGVMAVDFRNIMNDPLSEDNINLQNMDSIIVPEKRAFINVQGRVNNPGNVSFNPQYDYLDYITLAGGFGFRADESETFITKSKGEQFLAKSRNYVLEPGDVLLVPPKKELSFWEVFTTGLTVVTNILTIAAISFTIISTTSK